MASQEETAASVVEYIMDDLMYNVFDVVLPIQAPMYELLEIIVEEVEDIVAGIPVEFPSLNNPADILVSIREVIARVERVNHETWDWASVIDHLGCCLALRENSSVEVIRWIERGFAGTHFNGFDLQALVFEYECLFDEVPDTAASA